MALAARVATGVHFAPPSQDMLEHALSRTAALFRDRAAWTRMQANGMHADVSWRRPARRYANLYRELIASRTNR
jgi:starch synthase